MEFCFYDDADFLTDADRDSQILARWHQQLWSQPLPSEELLAWELEPGTSCLVHGDIRVLAGRLGIMAIGGCRCSQRSR